MDNKAVMILWVTVKLFPIITGIFFVCLVVKECTRKYNDIDNGYSQREIFSTEYIVDSTHNGFEVTYSTKNPVTKYRLQEMYGRKYIRTNIAVMKDSVVRHFGSLLYTDIYDFSDYIRPINIDTNLVIENIFVYGAKKNSLYIGNNPQIKNSAAWYDPNTKQGSQYLKHSDIYYSNGNERIYRYWKCYGLFDISETDERFSHFSEEDRVR